LEKTKNLSDKEKRKTPKALSEEARREKRGREEGSIQISKKV